MQAHTAYVQHAHTHAKKEKSKRTFKEMFEAGIVVLAWNLSTWEAETNESQVQIQPGLNLMRLCLK